MHRLFYATWQYHLKNHRLADYEVCPHLPCRVAWWLERQLWYGGKEWAEKA
jgi:hypothetical protein